MNKRFLVQDYIISASCDVTEATYDETGKLIKSVNNETLALLSFFPPIRVMLVYNLKYSSYSYSQSYSESNLSNIRL